MVIHLEPDLEAILVDEARKQGLSPETLAAETIRKHLIARAARIQPKDEWERQVLSAGSDCGVALSHDALSCEGLYE